MATRTEIREQYLKLATKFIAEAKASIPFPDDQIGSMAAVSGALLDAVIELVYELEKDPKLQAAMLEKLLGSFAERCIIKSHG